LKIANFKEIIPNDESVNNLAKWVAKFCFEKNNDGMWDMYMY
jgi:hypothetical protein